jgi:hypothetical protein
MFWPGSLGSDWRLALLGLPVAVACALAALIGPDRLAAGILSGQAWFWGINGFLLGAAHSDTEPPDWWHPVQYWHWLTSASGLVWLMPLLCLLVVAVIAGASFLVDLYGLELRNDDRVLPPQHTPDGLRDRVRAARRLRIRRSAAGGLVVVAMFVAGSLVDALDQPDAADLVAGISFWLVGFLGLAAAVHPDIGFGGGKWSVRLRSVGAAALLAIAVVTIVNSAHGLTTKGWSRSYLARLAVAVAVAAMAGVAASPYPAVLKGRLRISWERFVTVCYWVFAGAVSVAIAISASGFGDLVAPVVGGLGALGLGYLYSYIKNRRISGADEAHPEDPPKST